MLSAHYNMSKICQIVGIVNKSGLLSKTQFMKGYLFVAAYKILSLTGTIASLVNQGPKQYRYIFVSLNFS